MVSPCKLNHFSAIRRISLKSLDKGNPLMNHAQQFVFRLKNRTIK